MQKDACVVILRIVLQYFFFFKKKLFFPFCCAIQVTKVWPMILLVVHVHGKL